MLCSRLFLVICFIYSSVCMSPNLPIDPSPTSLMVKISLLSISVTLSVF